jgi:hypothetical protein
MLKQRFTEKQLARKWRVPLCRQDKGTDPSSRKGATRSVQYLLFETGSSEPILNFMNADICFSKLFYLDVETPCDTLFVSFLPWMWKRNHAEAWVEWVVNHSFFKDVFITKDVYTWREYGGLVRTDVDRTKMEGALSLLREAFDDWQHDWLKFVMFGFSPNEAYALSRHLAINEEGDLQALSPNTGHTLIPPGRPLNLYHFTYFVPKGECLSDGYTSCRSSLVSSFCGGGYGKRIAFAGIPWKDTYSKTGGIWGRTEEVPKATRANLEKFLQKLGEL